MLFMIIFAIQKGLVIMQRMCQVYLYYNWILLHAQRCFLHFYIITTSVLFQEFFSSFFLLVFIEFIGVRLVDKIIQVSGLQLYNTSPVYCIVCSLIQVSFYHYLSPLHHLLPPLTPIFLQQSPYQSLQKTNFGMIQDLNVKNKVIKVLGINIGVHLFASTANI